MNIVAIANQAFAIAVFVTIFAIGLRTRSSTPFTLDEQLQKSGRAFLAMFVAVPAVMMIVCYFLPMPPAVEVALIAVSVSPMLPTLPNDLAKLGADNRYAIGLQVVSTFMALIAAPIAFWIVGRIAQVAIDIEIVPLLTSIATGVLLPLALGFVVRMIVPDIAARIVTPLNKAAGLVLLLCILVILWSARALIVPQLDAMIVVSIVILVLTGLAAGHFLAGEDRSERAALALTAASRHIGFAIAISAAIVPKSLAAVGGTILLYFIARGLLVLPYQRAMSKRGLTPGDLP